MPKTIGEFINDLALKAGVKPDDEGLKSVLAAPELINVKVGDELMTAIDNGLLSIDAAKNNHPDIKSKYFSDAFDGMDKKLLDLIKDDAFTDEDRTAIAAERLTTKKMELALSILKSAKSKAADPKDKEAINQQIKDLHEAARKAKEENVNTVKDYEEKIKNIKKEAILSTHLGNYKTIYDELDPAIKITTLNAIINKALQDNDAELSVSDNGTLNLIRKDGSNVFGSDHRQHTPQSFLDKTLAPILKVSNKANSTANNGVAPQQMAVSGQTENASLDFIRSHNQQALQNIEQAKVQIV